MTAADPSAYASAIRAALLSDPSVGIPARVDPELAAWVHMTAEHLAGLVPLMADAAEQRVLARAKAVREVERAAPSVMIPLDASGAPAGPAIPVNVTTVHINNDPPEVAESVDEVLLRRASRPPFQRDGTVPY